MTEPIAEKKESDPIKAQLRHILTHATETVEAWGPDFDAYVRRHYETARANNEAEKERFKNSPSKHFDAEIQKCNDIIKSSPSKSTLKGLNTIRSRVNHDRWNDYQFPILRKQLQDPNPSMTFSGFVDMFGNQAERVNTRRMAAVSIWSAVRFCRQIPLAPEQQPLATFLLPPEHADKTDQEGKPYYIAMNQETGLPVDKFDKSTLSMTQQAISMRKRKYAGPTKTAEQYRRDRRKVEKEAKKRGEDYLRRKNIKRANVKDKMEAVAIEEEKQLEQARKAREKKALEDRKQQGKTLPPRGEDRSTPTTKRDAKDKDGAFIYDAKD